MKTHTTLTIDKKLLTKAKKENINLSETLEYALTIKLGLENDLKKISLKEQEYREKLDFVLKEKQALLSKIEKTQAKETIEKDQEILLEAWKRKLRGNEEYFGKIIKLFCKKYEVETSVVMDFLVGRRQTLPIKARPMGVDSYAR